MLYIETHSTNPYYNLAAEEYLVQNKTENICMLWRNDAAIIVGRNQNTMAEVDYEYITAEKIPVVRRMSGGGAAFHDLENLNFTYIINGGEFGNYGAFSQSLRNYVESLGLKTELSGRNDVLIDGKKFSGLAQYKWHDRLMHHGCILINADMTRLARALKPDEEKIKSKGVQSVQSRVVNIGELVPITCEEFMRGFEKEMKKDTSVVDYELTESDLAAIDKLCREKYSTYEWNFGYSPKYTYHNKKRFDGGGTEVFLDVADGIIKKAEVYGDFFSLEGIEPVIAALEGQKHDYDTLSKALEPAFKNKILGNITKEQFLSCLI